MIPEPQIKHIKGELIQQIKSAFPEEKKAEAVAQIESMNSEQLEQFLIQNNLVKTGHDVAHGAEVGKEEKCIFCSIISGGIQSYKIDENRDAIAILEINPISKAHSIVVPKEHLTETKKIPKKIFNLAQKIAKRIKNKLNPKEVIINPQKIFEHVVINVLPIYKDENLNSERKKISPEELLELQNDLEEKPRKKTLTKKLKTKEIKEEEAQKLWLPKRIP